MGAAVGIDLGTTNTVVAAVRDGRAVTLADEAGRKLIPSVVSFHPNGSVLVGEAAKERRLIDPANTIFSVKRLIGRSWSTDEVQAARPRFPFELREGAKNSTLAFARGDGYALPEISAFVLRRAKAVAEAALGEPVDRAVITVPANFNDLQRASTKVAGKLAGLEVLRILNEPTAAALAYGQGSQQAERLAVYDLGGGTFDITLLDLSGNVFEVLATSGDTALGGDDIDMLVATLMAERIVKSYRFDPRTDPIELARLRIHAERLKQELSWVLEASVEIKDVGAGEDGRPVSIPFAMTRAELERLVAPLMQKTLDVCRFAIETVGLTSESFDRVILVGGPTRMPLVARQVEAFFGKPPVLRVNPDEVVALGAAIQAHVLDRGRKQRNANTVPSQRRAAGTPSQAPDSMASPASVPAVPPTQRPQAPPLPPRARLDSVTAVGPIPVPPEARRSDSGEAGEMFSFRKAAPSLAALDELPPAPVPALVPVPPEPSALPPARPKIEPYAQLTRQPAAPAEGFQTPSGIALDRPISPAPAAPSPSVAPNVASSVPSMTPRLAAPLLIDVTPLSLRVETVGGYCDVLITANTAVPCDRTRIFLTAADGQTDVVVRVAQGESNRFVDNTFLGELQLTGLAPAPRGETHIGVTFEIDADGILNVKAKDVKSGRETKARLQLLGAQTEPADVDAMMKRQRALAVT